jgi:hypothetical protein
MNRFPTRSRALMMALMISLLPQCSSGTRKRPEPQGATVSRIDSTMNRGFDRKKKQYDPNLRSEFDQKSYLTDKKVKGQKFKTNRFSETDSFKGTSEFKAAEFSPADAKNRDGAQIFTQTGKKPIDSSQAFATSDSRYGSQSAKESDRGFAGGEDAFKTNIERDAAKAQKKNVLPKIIQEEDPGGKNIYTEKDVKQMLNRN